MTDPQSGSTDDRIGETAKEAMSVRSETDTASGATATDQADTAAPTGDDVAEIDGAPVGDDEKSQAARPGKGKRRISWSQALVYAVLPGLALMLAIAAGFLKWHDVSSRNSRIASIEAVAAAKDATIGLLSYRFDSAEMDLESATGRLTGSFKESYTQLIHDVVIPGAKQKHISSVATVPASASVSATANHAVVLLFVNQTTTVGSDPPTDSASSVRVDLDKIDGRWLVSAFDPV